MSDRRVVARRSWVTGLSPQVLQAFGGPVVACLRVCEAFVTEWDVLGLTYVDLLVAVGSQAFGGPVVACLPCL